MDRGEDGVDVYEGASRVVHDDLLGLDEPQSVGYRTLSGAAGGGDRHSQIADLIGQIAFGNDDHLIAGSGENFERPPPQGTTSEQTQLLGAVVTAGARAISSAAGSQYGRNGCVRQWFSPRPRRG